MANTAIREPIEGGDNGVWADFLLPTLRGGFVGQYAGRLYDDSGDLKITKGVIGIDNGTNKTIAIIDTVTTINMAGVSNSNWAAIEMAVSGTNVVFTATDIGGATDETTLPAGFTSAWNGEKQGFYINATKRTIGLAWKNAGGTLEGVVNVRAFIEGYIGYSQSDDANDIPYYFDKLFEDRKTVNVSPASNVTKYIYDQNDPTDDADRLKIKVVSAAFTEAASPTFVNLTHGLNHAKIRGVALHIVPSTGTGIIGLFDSSSVQVVLFRSTDVRVMCDLGTGGATGTLYGTFFYID